MIDAESITTFRKAGHGALTPEGVLVACKPFEHLSLMGVQAYWEELYQEYWTEAHEIVAEEQENAGDGYYHPEWHRFEMGDHTKDIAYLKAYKEGWVRLNVYRRKVLFAESTKEALAKHRKDLTFIADCLGVSLSMEQCS